MIIKRVLIAAGGTGGHIFPALAVADELKQHGVEIQWLGTTTGLEQKLVAPHYPLHNIAMRGIRGKKMLQKLILPFQMLASVYQMQKIIRKFQPQVILAMGGYVAAPAGIAAYLAKIPLIIHEQNAVAGYANRMLSRLAQKIFCAFPHTFPDKASAEVVGNPVRHSIKTLPEPQQRWTTQPTDVPLKILVIGGSRGAHALNQIIPAGLSLLQDKNIGVWHQSGDEVQAAAVFKAYQDAEISARVDKFINNMAEAYTWADLVICRAGALTISEIAAVGIASILIPYPYAVDDHQYRNGEYLAAADAAILIRQSNLNPEKLAHHIARLQHNRNKLMIMAQNARQVAQINATEIITQTILLTRKD